MISIYKRIKLWIYWRKKYSLYGIGYEIAVLFGINEPFSFRVMAPLELYIDEVNKKREVIYERKKDV